ncbi:MAG: TonB-dependent receptor [Acidobacteriales bacterium]|nr:TonB-dependent receptor [Terriglobales bacterium]
MTSKVAKLLVVGILLASATWAFSQGISTGSISGTVEDPQGAVVSAARVTATNTETNTEYSNETDTQGFFALRALPVGTYNVTIEAPKFSKVKIDGVVVNSRRDTALGARRLSLGASEVLEVIGEAPLVESSSSQISTSFSSKKITELPINNGVDQLAYLVPGVAPSGDAAFGNSNGASFGANGQRGRSTNFQIDGQGNNDNSVTGPQLGISNPDTIAEFQISTNFTAESGRNLGSVVNLVTKSGSNKLHGTVHEFHTNHYFHSLDNAEKSPFLGFCPTNINPNGPDGAFGTADDPGCQPVKKNQFIENRYGFTLGGPVVRDKAWFYGSYQRDIIAAQGIFNTGFAKLPTATGLQQLQAALPGNLAVATLAAIGPTAYPGAVFTSTELRDIDSNLDGTPDVTGIEFGTVQRTLPQPFKEHEWSIRGDWQITQKDRFFTRFLEERNVFVNATQAAIGGFAVGQFVDVPARSRQLALDWVRTWTPKLVNQLRLSYGKLSLTFEGGSNPDCMVSNPENCPARIQFVSSDTQNFGLAANLPQGRAVNNYQVQDNMTWSVGRQTLKFGGEFVQQISPSPFLPNFNGVWSFFNFDAFVANVPSQFVLGDGPFSTHYREKDLAFYFQDDWRVKDNLTFNLGVRWEWYQQAINILNVQSVARQTGPNPFWNTTLPLDLTTVPRLGQDLNNWGPVVGFAWTPRVWKGLFGEDKTVIRGGYGIKYDPAFYNIFLNVATSAPHINIGTLTGVGVAPPMPAGLTGFLGSDVRAALQSVIPSNCGTTTCDPRFRSQTRVDPNFHSPYSQQWTFGIQRQLTTKIAAEVRYVGNHSIGLFQSVDANPALNNLIVGGFDGSVAGQADVIPDGVAPCALPAAGADGVAGTADDVPGALASRRHVQCDARNVIQRGNYAFSIHHGLQSRLDFQGWHGLSANLAYTWSRTIDNASEIFSTFAGGQGIVGAQDRFDANRSERGVSALDYPHVFSLGANYELPWQKNQNGLLGHLLGGWQLNTVYRYTSGQPWNPLQFKSSVYCDPTNTISATVDTCRPILHNEGAPFTSVGQMVLIPGPFAGQAVDVANSSCFSPSTGLPIAAPTAACSFQLSGNFHWLVNEANAAAFFGTPYLGVARNSFRGQSINNVNLGVFKNTKLNERITIQFQANAYNVFNRQFRGTPDPFVQNVSTDLGAFTGQPTTTFSTNFANPTGNFNTNAAESGIGVRRLIFGLKVIF